MAVIRVCQASFHLEWSTYYELKTIKNIDAQFTTSENEKGKLSKIMTVTIFGKMTVTTSRRNDDQPYKEFNN